MKVSVVRRLAALEARLKPVRAGGNLNAEINVMTADERNALREFLLLLKDDGQPGDTAFDSLRLAAEEAVMSARRRLEAAL